MAVIDFHSHILPGIDDGSRSTEESVAMLKEAGRQGVDLMLATSHFYASRHRVENFLNRRQHAWDKLKAGMEKARKKEPKRKMPEVRLGAEVAFFSGISRAEEISRLTIEGTDLLLLEMPFGRWTGADLDEVEEILEAGQMRIILAHLERFLMVSSNKKYVYELMKLPVYVQVNAGSLLDWKTRGRTLKLLHKKGMGILGSDCHGIDHRVPNLAAGREVIRKKMGEDFFVRMDDFGEELLEM